MLHTDCLLIVCVGVQHDCLCVENEPHVVAPRTKEEMGGGIRGGGRAKKSVEEGKEREIKKCSGREREIEKWGAAVDALNSNPILQFCSFQTHFLDQFVPVNYRYDTPMKWYIRTCNTGTVHQKCGNRMTLMRFLVVVMF